MFGWIKALFSRKKKKEVVTLSENGLTIENRQPNCRCTLPPIDYDKLEQEQEEKHSRYLKSLKNQMNQAMCSRLMKREQQRGRNRDKGHRKRKSQARNWKRWREKC